MRDVSAEDRENVNCLAGMRCPNCGSNEPFRIAVTAWAEVWDDGTEDAYGFDWTDDAACICAQCHWMGMVKDALRTPPLIDDFVPY